jgi:uncharacterized membrane-anchored protein YitT (DUF2179 family)
MGTTDLALERTESVRTTWGAGVAGGLVAGIGMGLVLHLGANAMALIGALGGWPTATGGWAVHLTYSVLIALLFTVVVSRRAVAGRVEGRWEYVVGGVAYATAVGLVTVGVMLPAAMSLRGTTTLPEPILPVSGGLGVAVVVTSVAVAHLVYGVLLGVVYGIANVDRGASGVAEPT